MAGTRGERLHDGRHVGADADHLTDGSARPQEWTEVRVDQALAAGNPLSGGLREAINGPINGQGRASGIVDR